MKARILDSHPVGTYQAGNLKVQVKPGARRINAGTFEEAYPATKYPGAYQLRPRRSASWRSCCRRTRWPITR